ncbi:transcriptional activator [Actinidia rufa]|uniref:Transcriptional activator n=1 Tax=Actinidia rufa TaxID=165716 RepID=A0A7J0GDA0_9ERIC|nr:transcriptional activator [Actinidia rufa]
MQPNNAHAPSVQTMCPTRERKRPCYTWGMAFGVIPPAEKIDSGRLRMLWLRRAFDVLPEHANDPCVTTIRIYYGTGFSRTLVGNPAHPPTSGYVDIGSTIEIATRYIAAIHDRIDCAIYAYDRPESLQDMYTARDMCSRRKNTRTDALDTFNEKNKEKVQLINRLMEISQLVNEFERFEDEDAGRAA